MIPQQDSPKITYENDCFLFSEASKKGQKVIQGKIEIFLKSPDNLQTIFWKLFEKHEGL